MTARARALLPSLTGYRRAWRVPDVVAGLSAGAVVVPQAMAYATIAGLPVQVGLYTCVVPMLVYALLGGSRAMSVSSTSTVATLTATTLVTAGVASGSDDALGTLMALSALVGAILLLTRALKLGSLIENVSDATVLGVKIGVGGTVAVGQLPKLLGEDAGAHGEGFIRAIAAAIGAAGSISGPTVALSAASILTLVVLGRFAPRVPGTLVVAVAGILLVAFAGIDEAGVALIDPVPAGLPTPGLPELTHLGALVPGALAISLMVFLESATVARSVRRRSEPQIDADRELLAIGAANLAGAFFTTLPAAGGLSQSAVNQRAGARTQLAALVTVALAVLIALFLAPVVSLLPQATLASLVFVAVASLIDVPKLARWARVSPHDFWVALIVAVVGLTAGLLAAVAAGVALTLYLVLRELNTPRIDVIERRGSRLALYLGRGMYTANAHENVREIIRIATESEPPIDRLVLDVRRIEVMTITIGEALEELGAELADKGIELHFAALPAEADDVAEHSAWYRGLVADGRVHPDVARGLAAP